MSFAPIVGNPQALGRLRKMTLSGQVPSSLLFCGPEGVGKLLAAKAVAKALNCPSAQSGEGCDACPSCRRIDRGEHPDVRFILPEGKGLQIKVESIRDLAREVVYRPFEGRRRVFILNDADAMNPSAANALLKSLEEPPPQSHLILVTAHEADLLPTLRSRCQTVRFVPLHPDELVSVLVSAHGFSPADARLAGAVAAGNLSRALSAPVESLTEARSDALDLLGTVTRGTSRREMLALAENLSKQEGLPSILRMLLSLVRDVAAVSSGSWRGAPPPRPMGSGLSRSTTGPSGLIHADVARELEDLAERAPLASWIEAYGRIEQAARALDQYANKKLTLETLLLDLDKLGAGGARKTA